MKELNPCSHVQTHISYLLQAQRTASMEKFVCGDKITNMKYIVQRRAMPTAVKPRRMWSENGVWVVLLVARMLTNSSANIPTLSKNCKKKLWISGQTGGDQTGVSCLSNGQDPHNYSPCPLPHPSPTQPGWSASLNQWITANNHQHRITPRS